MSEAYGAMCSDFSICQRLKLKMDLPTDRETVLGLFDRVRRDFPAMDRFRRLKGELLLESEFAGKQQLISIHKNSIRSGVVNPETADEELALHLLALEAAPYYLSISPLDIDTLELSFGFDFLASGNHDQIVFDALIAPSPLGKLFDIPGSRALDCQPMFGIAISSSADLQVFVEVKTRTPGGAGSPAWRGEPGTGAGGPELPAEPLTVFLTLRKYGPFADVKELPGTLASMMKLAKQLLDTRVAPYMLAPIREAIASSNA